MDPIITTCSRSSNERVLELGATHTVDYHGDVVTQVRDICPEGIDFFLDCVSAESLNSLIHLMRYDGSVSSIAGTLGQAAYAEASHKGLSVHNISLGIAAYAGHGLHDLAYMGHEFVKLWLHGLIKPMITNTVELKDVVEFLPEILASKVPGKTIVHIK
jgi:NADPH:quinone reductase-like Zn-dependent oxidoreductase